MESIDSWLCGAVIREVILNAPFTRRNESCLWRGSLFIIGGILRTRSKKASGDGVSGEQKKSKTGWIQALLRLAPGLPSIRLPATPFVPLMKLVHVLSEGKRFSCTVAVGYNGIGSR